MRPPLEDKRQSWIEGLDVAPCPQASGNVMVFPNRWTDYHSHRTFHRSTKVFERDKCSGNQSATCRQLSDLDEVGALTSGQSSSSESGLLVQPVSWWLNALENRCKEGHLLR